MAANFFRIVRLQMNFFRPLSKVISKERRGARVTKRYDVPRTPYQRLLEAGVLEDLTQAAMDEQLLNINPAQLQRHIELALRRLWNLTTRCETLTRKVG